MTTRRESSPANDALPRIVSHRLQQTGGHSSSARAAMSAPISNGTPNGSANGGRTHNVPAMRPSGGANGVVKTNGAAKPSASLRQVVLVDRDIDALRDIAIALRDEYDFHITISGNEALALLHDGAIDTIVVGQNLYSSTGINVLSAARRSAPGTRRVLLASAVEASGIERDSAGAAPFKLMHRPCTPDKLRELLEATTDIDAPAAMATPREIPRLDKPVASPARPVTPASRPAPRPAPIPPPVAQHTRQHDLDPNDFEHVVLETAPDLPRRKPRSQAVPADVHLPIIIYTDNAEFYQGICAALEDRHDVRLATQIERVVEFAEMGQCPILITDRPGTQVEFQRVSIAVRATEPALVVIASGSMQDGHIFRKLIGTGALHSFLPKPLSPQLVKLAVEGARRHHLQLKYPAEPQPELTTVSNASPFKAPRNNTPPSLVHAAPPVYMPRDLNVDNYKSFEWPSIDWRRALPITAAVIAIVAVAAVGWHGWQVWNRVDPTDIAIKEDMQRAQAAFDAGDLVAPNDASAVYYYREVLKRDSGHSVAQQGLNRIAETLVEQSERAIVDEDLDKAALTLASLREVQPDHKRLPYLDAQLNKARSYRDQPRQAANNPAPARRAAAPADAPTPSQRASTASNATPYAPISNETQRQQAIALWLSTARQRMSQGQLIRPENDSAEFYLRQVERADPDNATAQQLIRDIGSRLLVDAQDALSRQQMETARRRIAEASRLGGDAATIARLQSEIEMASNATSRAQFLRLALQRARDNQLLEPDRDSAKYYFTQLQRMDPSSAETEQARRAVGLRLIDNANQAASQQQFNTAVRLLNEARQLGFNGPELAAAETKLRTARAPVVPTPATTQPLSAAPKVVKTVSPRFPEDAAKAGVSGWVDVSFRITANGDVAEAAVVGSDPPGPYANQFERAALAAIRQYKFEARNINDAETAQRMVVRMQFKLQ